MVPPACAQRAATFLSGNVGGEDAVAEDGVVKVQVTFLLIMGKLWGGIQKDSLLPVPLKKACSPTTTTYPNPLLL